MTIRLLSPLLAMLLGLTACGQAGADGELPPAQGEGAPPAPTIPKIEAAPSKTTAIARRYIGSVVAKDRVEVAAERGGTLADVRFDVGDAVKKGEVLFRLKAQTAKLSLSQSRKGLQAAERQFKQAKLELDRIEALFAAGAATTAARDQAQAAYDAAEIQVAQAEVAVDLGRTGIGDATTRAPISGIVVERNKDPGEAVTMMPPTIVVVIEDQSVLEVRARVPELALRTLSAGTKLRAHFPAVAEDRDIEVKRIGASVDPRTRTIEIIANVENSDFRLKPGMSVEVVPAT